MAKTILGKFFARIGDFFKSLFDAAEKTWDKLSPELKKAMEQGSGIIELINGHVDQAPDFVFDLIQKKYPELTRDKIHEVLTLAGRELNLIDEVTQPDLTQTIQALQKYLDQKQGKFWATASSLLAQLLAIVLAPSGTKFATVSSLMEFVYQKFVKKD